jgi:hypothetical protein
MLRVIVLVWFGSGCSWLTPLILFVHDLLQYIINAGATAATMGASARRRHRYPTPSSPPPPTSFPSPRSRRRRRRRRYPAALATTGAGAAAATGPEPAPPTTGGSGGRIWGRGNKNTVAYPVPEQDMQKRVQSSRRSDDPDQPRTGSNNQQDKCQDNRDKIAG